MEMARGVGRWSSSQRKISPGFYSWLCCYWTLTILDPTSSFSDFSRLPCIFATPSQEWKLVGSNSWPSGYPSCQRVGSGRFWPLLPWKMGPCLLPALIQWSIPPNNKEVWITVIIIFFKGDIDLLWHLLIPDDYRIVSNFPSGWNNANSIGAY